MAAVSGAEGALKLLEYSSQCREMLFRKPVAENWL
jgi:hypothetical protein